MPRNCGERWVDTTQRLQLMNGKKTTSKLSVLPTFHTQGTTPTTPQSRYKREEKHFKISFWKAFLEWSSAAASTDGPRQPPHSSFLLWEPVMMRSRSKPRSYKCVTRTDLNPSHIHGISFCSWESPGNWNRTFQLYIRDVKPFKKGGNLEHSQKLYIKFKKKKINTSICIFTTQQSFTARFSSWHTGTDLGLLQHSWLQMWFFNSRRSWPYLNVAFYFCCTDATESLTARGEAGRTAEGWEKATELLLCIHLNSQRTQICSITLCTQYSMQVLMVCCLLLFLVLIIKSRNPQFLPNHYRIVTQTAPTPNVP